MKVYFTALSLLLSVATVSAADNGAFLPLPAPAAAPAQTDSLPSGRHKVSTYNNGSSLEVVVEDREIKSLKIDGKEIPADEYERHIARVEELLGTRESGGIRMYRGPGEEDLEGLEEHFEGLGNRLERMGQDFEFHFEGMGEGFEKMGEGLEFRFEGMGERFERMGERLGESFERMFDFEDDGNVMRFEFRSDGGGNWRMDTLDGGRSFHWRSGDTDPKGLNREMPTDGSSEAEQEILEMETMIERMERRKARMKADLERQERDLERQGRDLERQKRDLERNGRNLEREGREMERKAEREVRIIEREAKEMERREANYEVLVEQLSREGLIKTSGRLRKLTFDTDELKVNGRKTSEEAHARFLELYEQQTGSKISKGSSISVKLD